jgi:hypothetical protein
MSQTLANLVYIKVALKSLNNTSHLITSYDILGEDRNLIMSASHWETLAAGESLWVKDYFVTKDTFDCV